MAFSWIVRRFNWKIPDLYKGKEDNIYWYTAGLNWRAFFAWVITIWPSFRKTSFCLQFWSDMTLT
jgi:cytosine/uracil/thiamine/allantoin permease